MSDDLKLIAYMFCDALREKYIKLYLSYKLRNNTDRIETVLYALALRYYLPKTSFINLVLDGRRLARESFNRAASRRAWEQH